LETRVTKCVQRLQAYMGTASSAAATVGADTAESKEPTAEADSKEDVSPAITDGGDSGAEESKGHEGPSASTTASAGLAWGTSSQTDDEWADDMSYEYESEHSDAEADAAVTLTDVHVDHSADLPPPIASMRRQVSYEVRLARSVLFCFVLFARLA